MEQILKFIYLCSKKPQGILSALLILMLGLVGGPAYAAMGVTYTGRILKGDAPVDSGTFIFDIWIRSSNNCDLYYERRLMDMTGTGGVYSFEVGGAGSVASAWASGYTSLSDVFDNTKSTSSGLTGSSPCMGSFTPTALEGRKLLVSFTPPSEAAQVLPELSITAVPTAYHAFNANKIDGYDKSHLLRIDPSIANPVNSDLDAAKLAEFMRLVSNPNTAYLSSIPMLGGDVSGTLPSMSVDKIKGYPVAAPAGAADNGKVLSFNSVTGWSLQVASASSGDSSYTAKGLVQFDTSDTVSGISVTSGVAKVNAGTGPNQIVQLDGSSKMPAVDGSQLTGVTVADGSVTSAKILNGSIVDADISGSAAITWSKIASPTTLAGYGITDAVSKSGDTMNGALNMGGFNLSNTGDITMAANKYFSLSANGTDGNVAGQMWYDAGTIKYHDGTSVKSLGVAGAGITSLNGLTAGTQTFAIGTSGTAPGFNSATSTHTLNIPMASGAGVTAGLLSKTDYDRLGDAETLNAKAFDAAAASTMGQVLYFDSAADKWKVSAASAPADGQVLKWNDTNKNWEPAADTGGWTAVDASYAAKGIVQFSTDAATSGVNVASGVATVVRTTTGTSSTILSLDGTGTANMYAAGIKGTTSGTVALQAAGTTANYSLTLPNVAPAANQSLQSDASGNLSWVSALGAVSDTATLNSAKIWVGNGSNKAVEVAVSGDATMDNTGALTLASTITAGSNKGSAQTVPQITYDAKGRLTTVSEVTINDTTKLPLAGGTMTGAIAMGGQNITNTGDIAMAANKYFTLSANTTNGNSAGQMWYDTGVIKYYDGGSVKTLGTGISSLNGSTVNTQTFAAPGTSGTAPAWSTNTGTGAHTLNIPMASTSSVTAGLISKTEYDVFNSKQSNTLTSGSIWVGNASNIATATVPNTLFVMKGGQAGATSLGTTDATALSFLSNNSTRMTIDSSGRVGIGTSSMNKLLEVVSSGNSITQVTRTDDTDNFYNVSMLTRTRSSTTVPGAGFGPNIGFSGEYDNAGTTAAMGYIGTLWEAAQDGTLAGADAAMIFSVALNGTTNEAMRISSAGYLGVNNNNPGYPLSVNGVIESKTGGYRFPDGTTQTTAATNVANSTLNSAKVWVGNASNKPAEVSFSGDISSITDAGVVTVDKTTTAQANKLLSLDGSSVATASGLALVNTGTVTLSAQTASSTYGLKWPAAAPVANQSLQSDASGNLSWVNGLTTSTGWAKNGNSFGTKSTLGNIDNYDLGFITNNTEKMTILANGNVGIGTTSPATQLDLTANINAGLSMSINNLNTGSLSHAGLTLTADNGGTSAWFGVGPSANTGTHYSDRMILEAAANTSGMSFISVPAAGDIRFVTGGTGTNNERMRIDSAGNVGLGTTSPTSKLDIVKNSTSPVYMKVTNQSTGSSSAAGLLMEADNAATYGWIGVASGTGSDPLYSDRMMFEAGANSSGISMAALGSGDIRIATGGATERMRITSTGRFGIGTTSPGALMEISQNTNAPMGAIITNKSTGAANASGLTLKADNGGTSGWFGQTSMGNTNTLYQGRTIIESGYTTAGISLITAESTGDLRVATGGSSMSHERLRVDSSGKVGIGTTSPQAILDVASTGTSSAIIVPRADTANRPTTLENGMIRYNSTTNLFEFYENGNWVNYTTVSDGRLKANVVPVDQGLAIVNQLKPVFFDWDQNNPRAQGFGNQHEVGFIAQEVEKVLPEVVNKGEDGYRSVEYGKVVAVVVSAVQELYKKILGQDEQMNTIQRDLASKAEREDVDQLKAEISAKDQKIKELESRLQKIEERLNLIR